MLATESFVRSGKVRDLYGLGADRLLLVASDRISAFDVVLPTDIPDKGRVLTGLSRYWFDLTASIVPNHLTGTALDDIPDADLPGSREDLRGRTMVCRMASVLPVEIVVRGYLAGSGWKEYLAHGSVCGVALPPLLKESDRLPAPILTPATKAIVGEHDINIDFESMVEVLADWAPTVDDWLGREAARALAERARDVAVRLYELGHARCGEAGIILADTKFEMGLVDGELILVDEVMTPDSSRFWPADRYRPGQAQPSFDKQPLRDYLAGLRREGEWNGEAPPPPLPGEVVDATSRRYLEAYRLITGRELGDGA